MLRFLSLGCVGIFLAACTTTAPGPSPTTAPTSSSVPTSAPTQTSSPAPTTAPTPIASAAPTSGPSAETCGTDWYTSAGECGGEAGDLFLFQCPPDGRFLSIWGTDVYTSDSPVCTAAVHAGLLTFAAGGVVTIEIRPGQDSYLGSTRNGVTSSEYPSWPSSFAFVGGAVVQPTPSVAPSGSGAPSAELAALLAHVPDQMRVDCSEVTTLSAGEVIATQCLPDGVDGYLTYVQFDTVDNLRAAYFDDVDFFGNGTDGDDCRIGPSHVILSLSGTPVGRLICNDYTSLDPEGKIAKWTNEPLRILGTIVAYGGSFQDMYDIWQAAGPNP